MTSPTITQADRDAATKWAHAEDSEPAMQVAFAAHREAEAARIVAWLLDMSKATITPDLCCFVGDAFGDDGQWMCGNLADAIERGEYNLPPAK